MKTRTFRATQGDITGKLVTATEVEKVGVYTNPVEGLQIIGPGQWTITVEGQNNGRPLDALTAEEIAYAVKQGALVEIQEAKEADSHEL